MLKITGCKILLLCILYQVEHIVGQNIVYGKKAIQSTTEWEGVAQRATDGNTNSNYDAKSCTHTDGSAKQNWLAVDLEKSYVVRNVKLFNRMDCCSDRLKQFTVSISEESTPTFDGTNVTPKNARLCEFRQDPVSADVLINCNGLTGRYIFIAKIGVLTLCEVEAFGERTPLSCLTCYDIPGNDTCTSGTGISELANSTYTACGTSLIFDSNFALLRTSRYGTPTCSPYKIQSPDDQYAVNLCCNTNGCNNFDARKYSFNERTAPKTQMTSSILSCLACNKDVKDYVCASSIGLNAFYGSRENTACQTTYNFNSNYVLESVSRTGVRTCSPSKYRTADGAGYVVNLCCNTTGCNNENAWNYIFKVMIEK